MGASLKRRRGVFSAENTVRNITIAWPALVSWTQIIAWAAAGADSAGSIVIAGRTVRIYC